jgi:hypothetical protein
MDREPLPLGYMKSGQDYLSAIKKLGLHPIFFGWGREISTQQWLLGMVTSIIDAGGPLELNRLLFKAYNAEVTPKEVSPFIIRVYSPEIAPQTFRTLAGKNLTVLDENLRDKISVTDMIFTFLDVEYQMINAYKIRVGNFNQKQDSKIIAWKRFKNNVEKLAA